MTDTEQIIDALITTDGIHAFVFICEAADKYLPIVASLGVTLEDGQVIPVTQIDGKRIATYVDETRKTLLREDRIVWALRFFKKALAEQLLWMVANEPDFFKKRYHAKPAPDQPELARAIRKLADVDISLFQDYDPTDPLATDSPYSGYKVIRDINLSLGPFMAEAAKYGVGRADNAIDAIRFDRQPVEEITYLLQLANTSMRRRHFPGAIKMTQTPEGPYDLTDGEGPVETIYEDPDTHWRWFDLHRACSPMRDDRTAPSNTAITGHCANCAAANNNLRHAAFKTTYELAEPLPRPPTLPPNQSLWKHQAFFVQLPTGRLGERKGRKNQKPSQRLEKYIFELLRTRKNITGVGLTNTWDQDTKDFALADLTPQHTAILKRERPELFTGLQD